MERIDREIENEIAGFIDEVKELLTPGLWGNLVLDCSKQEVLVLWFLYRRMEANMSQIAEYIHAPLNTATGIVSRMEKKQMVIRERALEDKRIVTARLGEKGIQQMQYLIQEVTRYAGLAAQAFTSEEMELLFKMTGKLMEILKQGQKKEQMEAKEEKKVRKIIIE